MQYLYSFDFLNFIKKYTEHKKRNNPISLLSGQIAMDLNDAERKNAQQIINNKFLLLLGKLKTKHLYEINIKSGTTFKCKNLMRFMSIPRLFKYEIIIINNGECLSVKL